MNFVRSSGPGWRGLIALAAVAVMFIATAMNIVHNRPIYVDSASVVFTWPHVNPDAAYTWSAQPLITTGAVLVQVLKGPQVTRRIRRAGGSAAYNLALVNLYNEDYPDYGFPEALLTTSSASAASAQRTYVIARKVLVAVLAARQRAAGARRGDRILASVTDASGPVRESGSSKRSLAGLLVIATVCACTAWSVTSRRAARCRRRRRHAL